MCDAAHATLKRRARLFVPGIAVAAAHTHAVLRELFNHIECARQFRRNRDALDEIDMFKQFLHGLRRRIANEFGALRAALRFRNERPFDMNARDLFSGRSTIANCLQNIDNAL